jgi:hypothetical protein
MLKGTARLCAASALGGFSTGCKKPGTTGTTMPRNQAQAVATPTPCPPGTQPFSIILHGLFFVEVLDIRAANEQRIRVISPKCNGVTPPHEHKAGSWKSKKFSDISGTSSPGWQTKRTIPPDFSGLPTMDGYAGRIRPSKIHHVLDLPWPDVITPLRQVNQSTVDYGDLGNLASFPLVLALTYACGVPQDMPPIDNTDWSKDDNFHIFCEPRCKICDPATCTDDPCIPLKTHADQIIQCIKDCFDVPPKFKLQPKDWKCKAQDLDDPPVSLKIDKKEEASLAEIFPCVAGVGHEITAARPHAQVFDWGTSSIHLPMCASFILTP